MLTPYAVKAVRGGDGTAAAVARAVLHPAVAVQPVAVQDVHAKLHAEYGAAWALEVVAELANEMRRVQGQDKTTEAFRAVPSLVTELTCGRKGYDWLSVGVARSPEDSEYYTDTADSRSTSDTEDETVAVTVAATVAAK